MTAMDAQNSGKSVVKTTIGYNDPSSTTATGQVRTWKSGATTYTYAYDARGNITSISDGQSTTTYAYDSFDQLVRENNQAAGKTWIMYNKGFCCRLISSSTGTNAGRPRRSRPSLRRARARTAGRGTARTGRSARGRRRCSHSAARSGAPRRRARRAPAPWHSGSGPDCPRSPRGRGRPPR